MVFFVNTGKDRFMKYFLTIALTNGQGCFIKVFMKLYKIRS